LLTFECGIEFVKTVRINHVRHPKILSPNPAAKLGRKHGGRFAQVDGAVPVRLCAIGVGPGWNSLEGGWAAA
jgi:hypothetical protein